MTRKTDPTRRMPPRQIGPKAPPTWRFDDWAMI